MTRKKKKSQHGGRRPGAGRPRRNTTPIEVRLLPQTIRLLDVLAPPSRRSLEVQRLVLEGLEYSFRRGAYERIRADYYDHFLEIYRAFVRAYREYQGSADGLKWLGGIDGGARDPFPQTSREPL